MMRRMKTRIITQAARRAMVRKSVEDPGPGEDRFQRGYCVLGERTWLRIRREYEAGASAAWLSARYGAGQRTIAQHAKAGGWRKKDLAARADAALDQAEGLAEPPPLVLHAPIEMEVVAGNARSGAALALNGALTALMAGKVHEAQAYARLAEALGRAPEIAEGEARDPQELETMRFLASELGIEW